MCQQQGGKLGACLRCILALVSLLICYLAKKHPFSHQNGLDPASLGTPHTLPCWTPCATTHTWNTARHGRKWGVWHTLCNRGTWQQGYKLGSCLRCILVVACFEHRIQQEAPPGS